MESLKPTTVVWASPHNLTEEQLEALRFSKVEFLKEINPELFNELCNSPSDAIGLSKLAEKLCKEMSGKAIIQPAGSPAFQCALGKEIEARRNLSLPTPKVIYAHSKRVSVDEMQEDGTVKKVSIFKHEGWIFL